MAGKKLRVASTLLAAGVLAAGAAAILDRAAPAVEGLTITFAGGETLRIGRIALDGGLIGAALAQSGDFTIENLEFSGDFGTYSLPNIAFSGVNLARAEIEAAFTGGDPVEIRRMISRLSATSVSAPEMIATQTLGDYAQSIVYRGIAARDIVEGRIGTLSMEGATFSGRDEEGRIEGSVGAGSMTGLDLGFTLRFYTEAAGDGPNDFVRVHEGFTFDDIVVRDDDEFEMKITLLTGSEQSMRLLSKPFPETMRMLEELDGRDDLTPEETRASLEFVSDLFQSFTFGPFEAIGVSLVATGEDPVDMTIGSIAIDPTGSLGFTGMRIADIAGETDGGTFSIQRITSEGFSFEPVLDGMRRMAVDPSIEMDPAAMQRMIPVIGTTTITGVAANVAPEGPGSEVDIALGSLSITADEPYEGLPTNLRFSFANLAFDLPEDSDEEFVEQLRGIGYERLDVSGALAARWNETASEIVISEVSLGGVDMGSLALRGVVGGIGPGLFSADDDERMGALFSGAVKNVHLMFENRGVVERLLALQADGMGMRPEDVAMQFGAMAEGMLPAMLGGSDQARALGQAVAAFLRSPGEIEVSAQSRDPEGVPVFEFMMMSSPAALMEQIDLTAIAR